MLNLMHRVRRVRKLEIQKKEKAFQQDDLLLVTLEKQSWQPAPIDLCCLASSATLSAH